MKIPRSIRDCYEVHRERYRDLPHRVERLLRPRLHRRWHYEGRTKELESFTLKLETGRVDPDEPDDFFGCTLVVENIAKVNDAEEMLLGLFDLHARRPARSVPTRKPADSFRFDDVRLYLRWRDPVAVRPSPEAGLLFECQVKTFLAHAWAIATHDDIYKSPTISWGKERVGYQIKAALEHADIALANLDAMEEVIGDVEHEQSVGIREILVVVGDLWSSDLLPQDRRRLATNIHEVLGALNVSIDRWESALREETAAGRGAQTLNLSPYAIALDAALVAEPDSLCVLARRRGRKRIFVPNELDIPQQGREIERRLQRVGTRAGRLK